jgi:hypothetical protein
MWHDQLGSNARAAQRIFTEWKKKARSEVDQEGTTVHALANRIGTLKRRGDPTGWWEKRPTLRQLLADLAEVDEDVIFQRVSSDLVFREFPALHALAKDEAPSRLDARGSTFDVVVGALRSRESARTWLKVPAGGGKSLAVDLLRARWSSEVLAVSVRTLRELMAHATAADRPIVAEVEAPHTEGDRDALDALHRHAHAVILLAPFDCPDGRDRSTRWSPIGQVWTGIDGAPGDGWIERMLRWVDERLEASGRDTKLEVGHVLAWIRAHEARQRAIRTPGDLLALCADFDQFGAGASLVERSERWLETFGQRWLPADAPRTWAARGALAAYREIVRADLRDTSFVHGQRPLARWAELMSDRFAPGPAAETPGRDMAVAYLGEAGLLRGGEHGAEPYPRWVGRGIVQGVIEELASGPPAHWGVLAADESRRALVDDALDELADRSLRAVRRRTLSSSAGRPETTSLGCIGALEAALAATARRLAAGGTIAAERDVQELQQLLVEQLRHLVAIRGSGDARLPLTRRDPDEWYVTGWAISLATPAPAGWSSSELSWVLPGWTPSLRLDDLSPHQTPSSTVDPWGATRAVQTLVRLAPRLLGRLELPADPTKLPRIFLPALFLAPPPWRVEPQHLTEISGSWEQAFLVSTALALPAVERRSLAQRLWQLVGHAKHPAPVASVVERIQRLKDSHPELLRFVVDNVPTDDIGETARHGGIYREGRVVGPALLRELPRKARSAAISAWLRAGDHRAFEVHDLVGVFDDADLDLILDDLRTVSREVVWWFAVLAWRVSPARALKEARIALARALPSVEGWFHGAPRAYLGRLVDDLQQVEPRPAWATTWALRRLLDAGPAADRLLALARADAPGALAHLR